MNNQIEALKMAKQHIIKRKGGRGGAVCYVKSDEEVIKAIDEALAQPAQEPVVWMDLHKELGFMKWIGADDGWDRAIEAVRKRLVELSTTKITNNPIAIVSEVYQSRYTIEWINGSFPEGTKLYTHPAPSWQGLSDDEIRYHAAFNFAIKLNEVNDADIDFARAIEQALKEKNT